MKTAFPRLSFKNTQISNLMKIRPMGAELFHADRRTDGQAERQTWRSAWSLFEMCLTRLKTMHLDTETSRKDIWSRIHFSKSTVQEKTKSNEVAIFRTMLWSWLNFITLSSFSSSELEDNRKNTLSTFAFLLKDEVTYQMETQLVRAI